MKKNLSITLFFALLIGVVIFILIQGAKPEVLPIGSKLPRLIFTTLNGNDTLKIDYQNKIFVLFFSEKCSHCKYELKLLNKNINKLSETIIYLFTVDRNYLNSTEIKTNKNLFFNKKVVYGIVEENEFREMFGEFITPSLYFFNKYGKLTAKINGETKIERIMEELKKP